MANASGSLQRVLSVPETVRGVADANPAYKTIRETGCTLSAARATLSSAEIRGDRMIADFRLGVRSADGDISTEISLESHDDYLEAVLCGTWTGDGGGASVIAGLQRRSFTIVRDFMDIGVLEQYVGCEINQLQMSVSPGAIATATYSWMADDMTVLDELPAGNTIAEASTTETLTGLTGQLLEGVGGGVSQPCTQLQFTLDNGMTNLNVIGSDHVFDRSIARSTLTGTATYYFTNAQMLNKFLNETQSAIKFQLRDSTGENGYDILIPRIKYTAAPTPVNDEGPITIAMGFQALLDPTVGSNIQITRIVAGAPVNTVAPGAPTGTAQVGEVLTAVNGTWTGDPAPTFTYQWLAGGVSIAGATNSTYTPVVGDVGKTITVKVTATNTGGTASVTSAPTAAVIAAA